MIKLHLTSLFKNSLKNLHPPLLVKNISKSFQGVSVLQNVSFQMQQGTSYALIGPSGVGKSIFLKALLGFIPVDKGSILFDGQDVLTENARQRELRFRQIGVVFQSSALFDSITIWENIAFELKYYYSSAFLKERVEYLMDRVELKKSLSNLYPSDISGGTKRRVSLARAIALNPRYLFFDEPTSGLDPVSSSRLSHLIRQCIRELNAVSLIITHDINRLSVIADEVAMIYDKHIFWKGAVSEIFRCPHPLIQQFVRGNVEGPLSH